MINYKNNLAVYSFMKLSYMMIGYFYFYFHPNTLALSIFTILYLVYVVIEMSREVYSISYHPDQLKLMTFLDILFKKNTIFNKDQLDLEYVRKKQDYAFNNNKIYINAKYRISSIYWNKNTYKNLLEDLGKI